MLKMRLQRVGRRNDPSYRVVVTDSRTGPKSNKHVDLLGSYSPKLNHVQIDGERAKDWIKKGVQVSDTVHNILVGQKLIDGKKINVLPRKSPLVSDEPATEEVAPETPATDSQTEAPAEEKVEAESGSSESEEKVEAEKSA